jgi:Na+-driven multidrug efflux pump
MTFGLFMFLLAAFSTLTGLVTEAVKKLFSDKANYSSNVLALVIALVIGIVGTAIYYQLMAIAFTLNNIIYMILMGLGSALVSMVGYDKVKQAITQVVGSK